MIQADVGHQPLHALAPLGPGARPPQVIVAHQHAGLRPPPGDRPSHQALWQAGGFLLRQDVWHRRLAHVHDGSALPVPWEHLLGVPLSRLQTVVQTHRYPPPARLRRAAGAPAAGGAATGDVGDAGRAAAATTG